MKEVFPAEFDFETGALQQSPCKTCPHRDRLPGCIEGCPILEAVQRRLSSLVSCSQYVQEEEGFRVVLPGRSAC